MTGLIQRLRRDDRGAAIIEFGILAPAVITMLVGVLQVGLWMQTNSALRAVAAQTGRYVAVQYQKSNKISNIDMAVWARNHAINHYLFDADKLSTEVVDASAQTVSGVTEKTLTINYTMKSFISFTGAGDIPVTFKRPIFVSSS